LQFINILSPSDKPHFSKVRAMKTPAKKFQLHLFLNRFLKRNDSPTNEEASNMISLSQDDKVENNPIIMDSSESGQQEALIEIGPRLDIQAGIDLLDSYKKVQQKTKNIKIDLKNAQAAHGAVIQTLLVIQKSCKDSEKIFTMDGLSSELLTFFRLAGLNDLLVENQVQDSSSNPSGH
jgi:ABC-type transporter Mla MlaB component